MRFLYQNPELERELAQAVAINDIEAAFAKVTAIPRGFRGPEIYGRTLFAKDLDALIPRLARRLQLKDAPRGAKSNDNVCILSTRIYPTGGHTRIAMDLIERLQPAGAVMIMTDIFRELRHWKLFSQPGNQSFAKERACVLLSSQMLVERVLEAYMILEAMRPSRIVLMSHPMDIVAAIAAWPFRDVVEFIHHADHVPALGATLPFSSHVDVTYTCHLACREAGLNPVYAGMAASAAEAVPTPSTAPGVRIVTCGGLHKYRGRGLHAWTDYAVAALNQPGSELIHIGATDEAFENEVRGALAAAAIAPDRYVFAGYQPSLPAELMRRGASAYLGSYPESGGKANLEAVMTGIPTIVPVDQSLPPLIQFRLPLPGWMSVSEPAALPGMLATARAMRDSMQTREHLAAVAQEARRFDDYAAGRPLAATSPDDRIP
jgi:hypothetical protein